MPDGMRSRPAANRAATKDNWVTVEGVSILPETVSRCRRCGHPLTAEASLRWLLGPDGATPVGESLTCSCGADCPTHGIITLDDRLAAFEAGRQQGVIQGRMQAIGEDVAALEDVAHLVGFITERAVIAARDGQDSAALFVERTDTKAVDR